MSTEQVKKPGLCHDIFEEMQKNLGYVRRYESEMERHKLRTGECAAMEVNMCIEQAARHRQIVQELGDVILSGNYPQVELREAV